MKLWSLWSFIFHIADIGVWKYVFTGVITKIKMFHSCHNPVVTVAILSFVSLSCRTSVACVWHSCCKQTRSQIYDTKSISIKTREASGFKSLRLNCWNIIQVMQKCKMSASFRRILICYLVVYIKKINLLSFHR